MEKTFEPGPVQKQWIADLRAHPERQLKGTLGRQTPDGTIQLCCLGQLALTAGAPHEWIDRLNEELHLRCGASEHVLVNYEEFGLRGEEGQFEEGVVKIVKDKEFFFVSLAEMNDEGITWPQIADYIEAHPENVFTKAV